MAMTPTNTSQIPNNSTVAGDTCSDALDNLAAAVAAGLTFKGNWDALANVPALASGVGTQGDYYRVSVAGNTNLDGITDWKVGDFPIFVNGAWMKWDNTEKVVSVFGRDGAVVAQVGDYTHAQLAAIGDNDHHNKSHAHDGVDGSGTVAHSDTTGQGTDDHHNEDHAGRHATGQPDALTPGSIGAEPAFSKNEAFNKDFGSAGNTVCEGDDARLSDSRDPNNHASNHTDGTDDIASFSGSGSKGLVPDPGSETGKFLKDDGTWAGGGAGGQTDTVTGSNGITNVGDNVDADLAPTYGVLANTICEGNDSRLSDARTPTLHAASHEGGGDPITPAGIGAEPAFGKNTAFNKDFGNGSGEVCEGDDARLSDSRTPTDHGNEAHTPNFKADFAENTAFNKNFGNGAGEVCQGNDSRLSDDRTPTSHDNTKHSTNYEPEFSKNTAFNKNFGSGVGTVCQGNDSRLSDDRNDPDAIHDDVAGEINALGEKGAPVGDDLLLIEDSDDSNAKKKVKISNLPSQGGDITIFFLATDYSTTYGDFRTRRNASAGAHEWSFPVPPDFDELVSCEAIGIYNGTGGSDKQIDFYSDYGAEGEDYNNHDESDIGTLFDFTGKSDKIIAIDVSGVLSALSAGDYVGLTIDHKGIGDSIDYIYIKLVYTPS